jgi:hypothetical protein
VRCAAHCVMRCEAASVCSGRFRSFPTKVTQQRVRCAREGPSPLAEPLSEPASGPRGSSLRPCAGRSKGSFSGSATTAPTSPPRWTSWRWPAGSSRTLGPTPSGAARWTCPSGGSPAAARRCCGKTRARAPPPFWPPEHPTSHISIHRANSCRRQPYAGGVMGALVARPDRGYAGSWMRTSENSPSTHFGA